MVLNGPVRSGKWRLWAGVLAVFCCGLIVGAAGGALWERTQTVARLEKLRGQGGPILAKMAMERLERELNLRAEQRDKIQPIVEAAFEEVHAIIDQTRPRMDAALQRAAERIKPLLDAEQAKRLDQGGQWRMLRPPPPPPPPANDRGPGGPPPGSPDGPPPMEHQPPR